MPGPYDVQQGQFSVQPPPNLGQLMGNSPSAITGGMAAQQQNNYQRNQNLENMINQMILEKNRKAAEEFNLDSEVRSTKRDSEIATNRAEAATIGRKKEGEAQKTSAEGALKQGTLATDIESGVSRNRANIDKNKLDQMERDVEKLNMALPTFEGPSGMTNFQDWAEKAGIDKNNPMRRYVEGATSGEDLQARAGKVINYAMQHLDHRRKLDLQREKIEGEGNFGLAREQTQGEYGLARQRLANEGGVATATARAQKSEKEVKLEGAITKAYDEMEKATESGDVTGANRAKEKLSVLFQMLQVIRASGAPQYPQLPGMPPIYQPRTAQPLPQPGGGVPQPGGQGGPIQWEKGPDGKPRRVQ